MSKEIDKNLIEKIKNFLIVVLVFMAILLLYFLWGPESFESFIFNSDSGKHTIIEKKDLIVPESVVISMGNGDYHMEEYQNGRLWKDYIVPEIIKVAEGKITGVEEITKEQYDKIMEYSSVKAKFKYDIPFATLGELYSSNIQNISSDIESIKEVGFSEGSKDSLFIYDGVKKKYFRIVRDEKSEISLTLKSIAEEENFDTYYQLQTYFGENTKNNTLLPVEPPKMMGRVDYGSGILDVVGAQAGEMAETYFGKSFDFVRKIEEADRTTVYMYGYGQRVLTINPKEGVVEYKQAPDSRSGEHKSMIEALDIALNFIGQHEDFKSLEKYGLKVALDSISPVGGEKKSGYRFEFSLFLNDSRIYSRPAPIQVEVIGGQISYFRKEYLLPGSAEMTGGETGQSAVDTIAANYDYMIADMVLRGLISKESSKEISFEELVADINNMKAGYLKISEKKSEQRQKYTESGEGQGWLQPVWMLELAGKPMYFDLKTGEPLKQN